MKNAFRGKLIDGRNKKISIKTTAFLTFMCLFLGVTGYFTYYSKVVYLNNLPVVNTIMPEKTDKRSNGRFLYLVPADAVHRDKLNNRYVLTARHLQDIMGERYVAVRVDIWILEKMENGMVLIDGLTREEPILTDTKDTIQNGDSIKY